MESRKNILLVSPKAEGNTYKVAEYLHASTHADLWVMERQPQWDVGTYDHIVLCSGVYGDRVHKSLTAWLKGLEKSQTADGVRFHLFLTWFGRGVSDRHAMEAVEKLLTQKGFACNEQYGSCFGGKFFLRKGHPDQEDLAEALVWLQEQIKA